MKTAEEWQEFEDANPDISPSAIKKQIQLDAIKHGMTKAANIALMMGIGIQTRHFLSGESIEEWKYRGSVQKAIEAARDDLKEIES
jgi:hypothetical protein